MFKPTNMPTVRQPAKMQLGIATFLGADLTNSPGNVETNRSPDCVNMIRDVPGKVRKRMGFYKAAEFADSKVNGHFEIEQVLEVLHVGTKLYSIVKKKTESGKVTIESTEIYADMANERSRAFNTDKKLYIVDGKSYICFDGKEVKKVSDIAKVPVFKIACDPTGIGTEYESINLLTAKYEQRYLGVASKLTYQMSLVPLADEIPVKASILQSGGTWIDKAETTDFTVNRATGVVTFKAAPGVSPVAGQDNIKITAGRKKEKAAEDLSKINKCRFGIQFGVNGANDRLFLSGNADMPNYDWYSEYNDLTYFADLSYSVIGQSDCAIIGYSIINARLAAHKNGIDTQQNVVLREGNLLDNKASFRIVNIMQGEGAVSPYSFAYIANEPVFLTRLGVYAITAQDITGEKYSQCRSFFINGQLLKNDLANAYACTYKDMYFLGFDNGTVYVLDGLQATQTDRSAPYSTRQYAAYHLKGINAYIMWQSDGVLWFGTQSGDVCCFYNDADIITSYNDNGKAIEARWQLPDISGKTQYRNKSFSRMYLSLKSAANTGLTVFAREGGKWEEILNDYSSARYFSFSQMCFSKISFSGDFTPRTLGGKIRVKKVDKAGFMITNKQLNEPFGLNSIDFEFKETGYFKPV